MENPVKYQMQCLQQKKDTLPGTINVASLDYKEVDILDQTI